MKRTKKLSIVSEKSPCVPELPHKKGSLYSSPMLKGKHNAKPTHDIEPMVLGSPPTGESIVQFAFPLSSNKTNALAEYEMIRNTARHLKAIVSMLEGTYGAIGDGGEGPRVKHREEGSSLSVGDDINSFLLYCSQFAITLEEAVKEERNILDSLHKWFQQQVNQMEEISKAQSILEDLPSDEKVMSVGIANVVKLMNKFQDLKSRLDERKLSLLPRHTDKEVVSESMKICKTVERKIEDFVKSHSAFKPQIPTETETEPGSDQPAGTTESEQPADTTEPSSVISRMNVMIKIFENQSTMLEKALNDQSLIEIKCKQMEEDYQVLLLEKNMLKDEIQKMKDAEKGTPPVKEDRKKRGKPEKKKDKDSEKKGKKKKKRKKKRIKKEE